MLDRNFIRDNLDRIRERLSGKGFEFDLSGFEKLDKREKSLRVENEELRALRNQTSEEISAAKRKGEDASQQIAEMKRVSGRIKELDRLLSEVTNDLFDYLALIPNLPHESVPTGKDETANELVRHVGEVPQFDFEPRDHVELGQSLGILDPERAAKITGARFANYYGAGALLERALINFMLDIHTREHGYLEMIPPFMANRKSFFGTGNLPKFEADLFRGRRNRLPVDPHCRGAGDERL